jgi:hypothetical protein
MRVLARLRRAFSFVVVVVVVLVGKTPRAIHIAFAAAVSFAAVFVRVSGDDDDDTVDAAGVADVVVEWRRS